MRTNLKLVLVLSGLVGAVVAIIEWSLWRFNLNGNWPPVLMDIQFYLWPAQMFFAGAEAPGITEAPKEHVLAIIIMYTEAILGNVLLYNFIALAGYGVTRLAFLTGRVVGRKKEKAKGVALDLH